MTATGTPEFSLRIATTDVPPNGREIGFEATEEQREALARRFDILAIARLKGTARVRPYRRTGLTLDCAFDAEITQACVVTLVPVVQKISESFTLRYLPAEEIEARAAANEGREIIIDADAQDDPEPLTGHGIDVGEAVAEHLSLSIDPYPRAPDAAFDAPPVEDEEDDPKPPNPFAVLEKLKKND